ncbi:MAG: hypothetical protein J1F05_05040 [Muribaculaceae bacterium]|nr:hypothetical protein [Muribaculaceae bacterium]
MTAIFHNKNITINALIALILLLLPSCVDEPAFVVPEENPGGPVLRLSTGSSFSRADEHPDDVPSDPYSERAEEAISRVDLFFFASEESKEAPFFTYEVKNISKATYADLTVKVPMDLADKFEDDKAYIYALVNLPEEVKVTYTAKDGSNGQINGQAATLGNIKNVWVNSQVDFISPGGPSSFVMRGGQTVDLVGSKEGIMTVSGVILLERLASKIRLWASIPDEIYVDENGKTIYQKDGESDADFKKRQEEAIKWTPVPKNEKDGSSNVKLYLYNLATRSRLDSYIGGDLENRADLGFDNIDRRKEYESSVRLLSTKAELREADKDDNYPYSHSVAYYSYPNIWDASKPSEEHQTYLVISMPWTSEDEDGNELFQVCYYLVPINALKGSQGLAERLDPNRYYRIKINLGMLGSKNLGDPIEVDASCEVVDWRSADVDVSIKDRRYLVVNQTEWVMNNVYTLEIPFYSSHKVKKVACYVTYFRYDDDAWGKASDTYVDSDQKEPHNKNEFTNWLAAADTLRGGRNNGEGLITADFDGKTGDVLYYKKKYFYDNVKKDFYYYIGHEHPMTFKESLIEYNGGSGMNADEKSNWKEYNTKYDNINAVYTCDVNDEKGIITFKHPLVQWKAVRQNDNAKTGPIVKYVPEMNTRTNRLWDEFSRCEIVIKIKHADWNSSEDHLFEETIYITQYPAMYVEVSHDYGGVFKSSSNRGNEYVIVNGNTTDNTDNMFDVTTNWYETTGWVRYFGAINNNPNMYVIHTTQLSEENEVLYDLGDPRTLYYNNILDNSSFVNYKSSNTESNGTPLRWSNANITEGLPIRTYDTNGRQDIDGYNSEGPAWWLSRDYVGNVYWGGINFSYSNYKVVPSLYPEYKPVSADPNTSKSEYVIPNHIDWDFVNHKNNLCYYYPTDESTGPGSKENFIAPVFRIASSLGKVTLSYTTNTNSSDYGNKSKSQARRRCAIYQEAGRPAGRWRVPTMAEIKYLVQLSTDGRIPQLFGNHANPGDRAPYWSASGLVAVTASDNSVTLMEEKDIKNSNESPAVRCVYDDWYWTQVDGAEYATPDSVVEQTFYWGDRPKDNTQVQRLLKRATGN